MTPAAAVVEAGGVGYYINISLQTFSSIESATEVKLYTHFIVREDAQVLYGFYTLEEREVFRALIGVSGVGGNTARMILSTFSSDEVRSIIATGQADVLKSVKGLGIKTAQKIIDFVISDPSMSAEAMAYKIGISSRAVEKHISKLRSMGILSREGADHGGYWRIIVNPQTEQ